MARMSMKEIMEKLPANAFMRLHRSFIVSVSKTKSIGGKAVYLDGKEIPIGASYAEEVARLFWA
jgi:DNA-binding LytR/AlgR family response regulator